MIQLYDFLAVHCKNYKEKPFLKTEKGDISTYSEFFKQISIAGDWYKNQASDVKNLHFSIIAPNCFNYLYHLFPLLNLGGTAVNLNPNLSNFEIRDRLILGKVSLLITTKEIFKKIEQDLPHTGIKKVFIIDEKEISFKKPELFALTTEIQFTDLAGPEVAFLQFTGGTTGITKAAVITHQQVIDNVEQLSKHIGKYISLENLQVLIAFPFYHIFSLVFNLLFFMRNGGSCILYQNLRDTDLIIRLLKDNPVNFTVAVNTWYKKLMQHPEFSSIDFSAIRASLAGGEYVPVTTKQQWTELTGKPLYSAYGLTETCSLAIVSPMDETNENDAIGVAVPDTKVALLDENNREILSENTAGEIALKGPQVTNEYFENEAETAKAFYRGWFKTGDIAEKIKGSQYRLVDRKKDMISVSGNKVYPNEVESVLSKLEDILDAGVVAQKSDKSGEIVAACIVIKEGSALTDDTIIAHCEKFLARFKVPKKIYRFKELPKSPIGKTVRYELRNQVNSYTK
ncbi:MAG: hypothetical protein EA412_14495 [Chitinophagaceae bacterium]|nr:MAG: hypothetical protein EA412_14495 [Chitinophagaceae bacterium]